MGQLTLRQFKVTFRSGIMAIVSDVMAHIIDDAYDKFSKTGNDRLIKLPTGASVLISKMVSLNPYVDEGLIEKQTAQENMKKIDNLLSIPKTAKQDWWKEKIKENIKRQEKGLPWVYDEEELKNY